MSKFIQILQSPGYSFFLYSVEILLRTYNTLFYVSLDHFVFNLFYISFFCTKFFHKYLFNWFRIKFVVFCFVLSEKLYKL